jgi:hypothetical protein
MRHETPEIVKPAALPNAVGSPIKTWFKALPKLLQSKRGVHVPLLKCRDSESVSDGLD